MHAKHPHTSTHLIYACALLALMLAACQPAAPAAAPTFIPFPTMTPGRAVSGPLPTTVADPLQAGFANPATAIALASLPTPTPNIAQCPLAASVDLEQPPNNSRDMEAAMARFLSAGGSPQNLENALRAQWGVLGAGGFVRADLDLTGEGVAEIIVSYSSPDEAGSLAIFGCTNGQVMSLYHAGLGGTPPEIVWTSDMTYDALPELLFASRACVGEDDDSCLYRTRLTTWRASLARYVNLIDPPLETRALPTLEDMDQDNVVEVITRFDNDGDSETGPLRTGVAVYDWNGATYVRSLIRLDAPRFRIQVIHAADAAFADENYEEAIALFQRAATDTALENWLNDDAQTLSQYAVYRLMLTYAFLEDDRLLETYQALQTQFPDVAAAPTYIQIAFAFWNGLQVTNNLRSACIEVQNAIIQRADAVGLLNRYGSENPTYDARALCPF
jgi:hypothetical protein